MKRFSIAALMGVILVCGLAVAALKYASELWAGALLCFTLLLLGVSILGVVYFREGKRAFWLGFLIFGGGYMLIQNVPKLSDQAAEPLPTTELLSYLHAKVNTDEARLRAAPLASQRVSVSGPPGAPAPVPTNFLVKSVNYVDGDGFEEDARPSLGLIVIRSSREPFIRIGHCLFALLAGLIGAAVARWFEMRGRRTVHNVALNS